MRLNLNEFKEIIEYLPAIVSIFTVLWVGFTFLDYLYEQYYCKYFNIASLVKKEYKYAFHPKYIVDILMYGFLIFGVGLFFLNLDILSRIMIILSTFTIGSILYGIIIYEKRLLTIKIESLSKVSKEDGKKYRKTQNDIFLISKIFLMIELLLLVGSVISAMYEFPIIVILMVCTGLFLFCGIKNDSFLILFTYFFETNKWVVYTIDHLNVITKNEKQYAIILPNTRICNDHIVACRVLFLKTNNDLTYVLFNTHETKVFDYDEGIDVIRYEPDYYLRITYDDGFDCFSDEALAMTVKEVEQRKGKIVEYYYHENDWKKIENITFYVDNQISDCDKHETEHLNDSVVNKSNIKSKKKYKHKAKGNRKKNKH